MLYITGASIPDNKAVFIALNYIYGIGKYKAKLICNKLSISKKIKIIELNVEEVNELKKELELYLIESELKNNIKSNINKLILLDNYRGFRHKNNLPVRGQRSRTNGKTQKRLKNILVKKKLNKNKKKENKIKNKIKKKIKKKNKK